MCPSTSLRTSLRALLLAALAMTFATTLVAWQRMPPQRTLTEQELVDMVVGAAILCTRGIDTEALITRVKGAIGQGSRFTMISLEDVPDDWLVFTSFTVGGGGAWPHVIERMERHGFEPGRPAAQNGPMAAQVLAQHLGQKFDATFQAEAGNATANTLLTAQRMNIPIIDACPSGRCLPEVQMSPFFLNGITRAPLAAVTRYGDVIVIPRVVDDHRVEDLTRAVAIASGGAVTIAANAVTGKVLKQNAIPGFLSHAIALGRAAREAAAAGADPVDAVVRAGDGYLLFRGTVAKSESKGEQGFGWTDASFEGTGEYRGSRYRIYNKNENMIGWRDDRLDAAAPDLISALDPNTGWSIRSPGVIGSFPVGHEVAIVGFRAHAIWRTPKAIEMLGPRHFGFDEDFRPLESQPRPSPSAPPR